MAQILSYAQLRTCRHARIADYFGEQGVPRHCDACDNCLDGDRPADVPVAPADLSLALAAAACFSGYLGAANLAAHLGGRQSSWSKRNPWATELSHFGALRWPDERLRDLLRALVEAGLLRQTAGEYPVLEITPDGRRALSGVAVEISLPAPAAVLTGRPGRGPNGAAGAAAPVAADQAVVDRLRQWRLEVSRTLGLPAYVVFHDRTLAEIAARSPRSLAELEQVPGVGPAKLSRYGQEVLTVLEGGRTGE